ncbi:MAG: SEC-C domain-containing protein [Planctomycetes bacterium]|nr:SEC-C domain-containing protein [Planctomycetota bacterium]
MQLDPYAMCPCGSGKKLKFCCADLAHDLEQIYKLADGGQRQACLDQVERLLVTHPERACLLSLKATLQSQLGMGEQAAATINEFVRLHPHNQIALADKAIVAAQQEGSLTGIGWLQRALEASNDTLMPQVYETMGVLAEMLLAEGYWQAGRSHAMMQLQLQPQDEQALQFIARVMNLPSMPALFKEELPLQRPPFDAPWQGEFDAAMSAVDHMHWSAAEARLNAVSGRAGNVAPIWQNLAVLRARLGNVPGTVDALRKLVSVPGVPLQDAIEAEAQAQLLDAATAEDTIDDLRLEYPINDIDRVLERLAGDTRLQRVPNEAVQAPEGEVPPRAVYFLLDRPLPKSGAGITYDAVPTVLGEAFVFGRETDKPARLVCECDRPHLAGSQALLSELAGDAVGVPGAEEVINHIPAGQRALMIDWRLPPDTPPDEVRQLMVRRRRDAVLNRWPKQPLKLFGGKTAEAAAADPNLKLKVQAALLLVEMSLEHPSTPAIVDELRGRLGLPIVAPIDPSGIVLDRLSLARLARLDAEKLSDDDLLTSFRRARFTSMRLALSKFAQEILKRPQVHEKTDMAGVYGILAELEEAPEKVLEYLGQARAAAVKAGRSCARFDMSELMLRLQRGEEQQASELFKHLQMKHAQEPGVGQALMQLLYEMGAIGPDGRPVTRAAGPLGAAPAEAAAAPANQLWTPGGPAAAPAGGEQKSALWMPGMD